MALAPPLQSTVNDDLFTGLKRTQDLSAMQLNYEPAVRGALANSLADNANKRQMAIAQQNADTARMGEVRNNEIFDYMKGLNRNNYPNMIKPWLDALGGDSPIGEALFGSGGLLGSIMPKPTQNPDGTTTQQGLVPYLYNAAKGLVSGGEAGAINQSTNTDFGGVPTTGATGSGDFAQDTDWASLGANTIGSLLQGGAGAPELGSLLTDFTDINPTQWDFGAAFPDLDWQEYDPFSGWYSTNADFGTDWMGADWGLADFGMNTPDFGGGWGDSGDWGLDSNLASGYDLGGGGWGGLFD